MEGRCTFEPSYENGETGAEVLGIHHGLIRAVASRDRAQHGNAVDGVQPDVGAELSDRSRYGTHCRVLAGAWRDIPAPGRLQVFCILLIALRRLVVPPMAHQLDLRQTPAAFHAVLPRQTDRGADEPRSQRRAANGDALRARDTGSDVQHPYYSTRHGRTVYDKRFARGAHADTYPDDYRGKHHLHA